MNKEGNTKDFKFKKSVLPGAIILGLITAIIIYAVLINSEKNALAEFEKGKIYIASADIPEGTLLSEKNVQTYFQLEELDKKMIPETAITTMEQLNGMVACYDIEKGTLLTLGMFESLNEITKGMEQPVIAGFKADDLYQVVGGILRAGDRIHIYSVDEEDEAILIWNDVYVQQVFDGSGVCIKNEDTTTSAQRINVYMDNKNITTFYSELAKGSLRVVLVSE